MAQSQPTPDSLDQTDANRQLAYRFYDQLWNKGNYAAAPELLHPDHFDHSLPPLPGLQQGRDGVLHLMQTFREGFPDLVMSVEMVIGEGDLVGEVLMLRGTHTGTFAGIPPTGKPIEIRSVNICRIEDGLVRERWGASDDLGLLRQIGVLPSPGTRAWNASIKAAGAQIRLRRHGRKLAGATAAGVAAIAALAMRRRSSRG
jgi:steroid delta-isomerase-like uncharacterized protein